MEREDWEIHVIGADGQNERRVTTEIQHDLSPHFLSDTRLLGLIGEGRHRRSYVYNLTTGERQRLHHNNLVRTVAPEYEWAPAPDGSKVLIVADRDGNTISAERSITLMDLSRRVTRDQLLDRIATSLEAETALRAFGERVYQPIRTAVADVVADVSTARISRAAHDVFAFGSKYITQPGNAMAIEYYAERLREYGYEPELQYFEARGVRTANIIAKLPGTVHPELVYVVSSHFDSVERGPGADDDSSGATALLEAARVLKAHPQPATIHFAFFTGEEAGLLGSRHYVQTAVERGDRIIGALNNDMVGFMNDHVYDNTIRYSNDGIRDIQHSAAFLFTNLVTYDAKYYRSTDAAAYFEAYGDIVGGIGSYPILGNPHYHQSHDVLETIDQQLVAEVSKTTVATLMLLASSPARLADLEVTRNGSNATARWTAAPESDVREYIVAWGPAHEPTRTTRRVSSPTITVQNVNPGDVVWVKAVNGRGLESWDWAKAVVQ
jgi:aminopeptidase YwaD